MAGVKGHKKEINILILGQTGVGKTTWINAFYNYVRYSNVDEAEHGGLKFLIPMQITMTDESYNDVVVQLGESTNEVYRDGESCTQDPFSHEFLFGNRLVRLIDTPGIGDSAGIGQDMKNFKKIVSHLQSVNQIHAILLLLKPNEARLDVTFQFCLKQLLVNLPREAVKNIVFCFTNTRGTNYKPGESLKTLKTLFSTGLESEIPIKLHKSTMYMFDSESVRFLAAKSKGIKFSALECTTFSSSWKISVTETERLFDHIGQLEPVATGAVATINETREIIQLLQKPIIDISAMIQENIQNVETIQREISRGHDFYQKLYDEAIPIKTINFKKLKTPRTVCASPKCTVELEKGTSMRASTMSNTMTMPMPMPVPTDGKTSKKKAPKTPKAQKVVPQKHYKSICHDNCNFFAFRAFGWTCKCFDYKLNCKLCKCAFSKHISIDFETCILEETDTALEQQLSEAHTEVEKKRIISENSQRAMEQLQREQDEILKASAVFANFLRSNAILNFNDAVADYMKVLIKVEKESDDSTANTKLSSLVKMLEAYQMQVEIEKKIHNANSGGQQIMSPQDIFQILENLYQLPRMGNSIRFLVEETRAEATANFQPKFKKINFEDEGGVGIMGKTGIMRQLWSRGKDPFQLSKTGSNVGWGSIDSTVREPVKPFVEIQPKKPPRVQVPYPPVVQPQQQRTQVSFPEFSASAANPTPSSAYSSPWDLKPTPIPTPRTTSKEPSGHGAPYPPEQPQMPYPNPVPRQTPVSNPVPIPQDSSSDSSPDSSPARSPVASPQRQDPAPIYNPSSILGPSAAKPTSSLLDQILAQPSRSDPVASSSDEDVAYSAPAAAQHKEQEPEEKDYSGFDFSKLHI